MKCPKCGAFLIGGVQVCPNCKTIIEETKVELKPINNEMAAINSDVATTPLIEANATPEPSNSVPLTVATPPVTPVVNADIPVFVPTKKKFNIKVFAVLTVCLIALIAAGYTWYIYTPKVRFIAALNHTYQVAFDSLDTKNNKILSLASDNTTKINSIFTLKTEGLADMVGTDDFNLKINAQVVNDPAQEQLGYNLEYFENNASIIGLKGLLTKDKLYLMVQDVMTNYYYTDGKYTNIFDTTDTEDYRYLAEVVKKSVSQALSSNDFKTSKEKITLGDTKVTLKKVSLPINEKLVNRIGIRITKNIIKDNKALDIIVESKTLEDFFATSNPENYINGDKLTKKELIKILNQEIKTAEKEKPSTKTVITYNVYIKGYNTIYRHEFKSDKDNYLRYDDYVLKSKKNKALVIVNSGKEDINIAYKEITDKKYQVTGNLFDYMKLSGTVLYADTKTEANLKLSADGQDILFKLTNSSEEKTKDKSYTGNTELTVSYDNFSLIIGVDNEYTFGGSMVKQNMGVTKDIANITEAEVTAIYEKIQKSSLLNLFIPSQSEVTY